AAITVTPRAEPAGPVTVTIRADPGATSVDPANAVVPAETITLPLQVSGDFRATGVKVEETRATGEVTFLNYDPGDANSIPSGSVVSTESGIGFRTNATVTVPAAQVVPPSTIIPGRRDIGVTAVKAGTSGNVPAGTITRVPRSEDPGLLKVSNGEPTSGGTRTETKLVAKKDYDAALKQLTARLGEQLQAMLADPATAPAGRTLFPATAVMTPAAADTAAGDLVGREVETFTLGATASATVTAVDESQLAPLAVARLRQTVPTGYELFEDSIRSSHTPGTADGTAVIYVAEASGEQWRPLDAKALLESVKGRPIAEARAELERVGRVEISTWPDWVETIPTLDARVSLSVAAPERAAP
ncbi:MAG TPA: baseplate J/gp47 family protein, partial [Candidatus Limnocylindrales bacterium]|nr:baseplate J/gp47 family protein [Candidatus Limnocylindrales bacterium]